MTIEEYKRGVRTMGDIMPSDRCMIVAQVYKDGRLRISNIGDKEECMRVYKAITLCGNGFDVDKVRDVKGGLQ